MSAEITPEQRAAWRAACDGESVFHETRIIALLDALDEAEQSRESEGWASYAAEQERHAETVAECANLGYAASFTEHMEAEHNA